MRIEVLTFEGCPHSETTRELVRQAVLLERVDAAIDFIDVASPEAAQNLRFLGSPSVRIDGEDAEPAARGQTEYGLMCRTYGNGTTGSGTPPIQLLRTAIRRAVESRDLLGRRWSLLVIYGLPAAAIVVSGFFTIEPTWRGVLWAAALATMGIGCLANAVRCGRVHCYVTGPFFLVMAAVALLYGLGILPLGKHGWNLLGAALLAGALVLIYLPERLFGTYRRLLQERGD